ncbi:hypothetical protein BST81_19520 [Leptolyngbya sp. 'hensonii']|uniref:DUF6760 family protein n=1 Tax=Leptolyngbya sp. 'hensonii' TaxID=1922337 RepID=UPI00094FA13C|nr:hypothetical protein BST81_19520 [Leptolyngbya sp. 'hensonii']
MSPVPDGLSGGADPIGGVLGYPPEQLRREVALIAYHFHWSLTEILNLEHGERRQWVQTIDQIRES